MRSDSGFDKQRKTASAAAHKLNQKRRLAANEKGSMRTATKNKKVTLPSVSIQNKDD